MNLIAGRNAMSETRQNLEEFLFEAALGKSSPAERATFLDGVCRNNPALRARLELLLEGHFAVEGFLTRKPGRAAPLPPFAALRFADSMSDFS